MVVQMRNLSVVLSAKVDRFKADMAAAGKSAADAAEKTETAWDKSSGRVGKSLKFAQQYEREMTAVGGVMAGFGTVVVGSLGLATRATMKWESAWAGVMKTVDGTPRQMAQVESGLRGLAKTLPATHEEIAGVAEAAGQLGIKTDNVVSFTKTMIDMGESTNISAEEAATALARLSNIMGTSQKDFGKMGAAIVGLGNNFATTEGEIVEMSMRIAGVGKQAGLTEGDVFGLATALSSVGINAEAGGTAVSLVMKKIGNEVANGGDKLEKFASVAGMSSSEFAAAWNEDAGGALDMFVQGLGRAQESGENVNGTLSELGITGIREADALLRLSASGDVLTEALKQGNNEFERGTALAEEAAKRYETAESKIKIAGNSLKDTAITIGGTFLPAIAEAAEAFSSFMDNIGKLPEPAIKAGSAIAGIAGAAALTGGAALILIPKIAETTAAISALRAAAGASTGALGKFGGALGGLGTAAAGAAVGLAGLALSKKLADGGLGELENVRDTVVQLSQLRSEGKMTADSLNTMFSATGNAVFGVEGFGDALKNSDTGGFKEGLSELITGFGLFADTTQDVANEQLANFDSSLAAIANSGDGELLAETFTVAAQEADKFGYSTEQLIDKMPELKAILVSQAEGLGLSTDNTTLARLALGEIGPAADEAADAVGGVGTAAGAAAEGLQEMLDGLTALGLATLSERDALRQYEEAVDGVTESIKENGTSLDITTEKGRANQEAFDAIAKSGFDAADAMVKNGADQEDVQEQLQRTYDDLIDAAAQFNITGQEAEDMAKEVMNIPKDVDIETWMSDAAEEQAKKTDKAVREIPRNVDIDVALRYYEDKSKLADLQKKYPGARIPAPPTRPSNSIPGPRQKEPKYFGGIDLMPMAAGGMLSNNIAQMVRPNTWRIVGDRMDVDEAFIPIDGSKRSWKILMETISRMPGAQPFARGAIASAQSSVDSAEAKLRSARRDKYDAESKKAKAQAARRVRIAEEELASARKGLKAAKEKQKADEKAAKLAADRAREERERRSRIAEMRSDVRTDIRRGNTRESVSRGLSGAYGAVDQLYRYGSNDDLSRGSRRLAKSSARRFESDLRSLYSQAERIDGKLKKAQDKAKELDGIKTSVVSSLLGGRDLDVGMYSERGANGQWTTQSNLGQAAKSLKGDVGAMKSFAGKLKKLNELGIPGAIIQEIAQAGVEEGSTMADSFIGASAGERKSYIGAWKDYEKYAGQAGQYVTEGFYKGGVNAANGVVKGLESQQKSVEKAIANMAKSIERTFKKVLGIHSPSTVMEEAAFWVPEAARLSIVKSIPGIQDAAAQLGSAMVPGSIPNAMAFDVTATPVVAEDEGTADLAMQEMSSVTLDSVSQMQTAVSEGFANMVANTQTAQNQMLLDTQLNQSGMAMSTQEKNAAMLLNTQTQQEAMRATVANKQIAQKNVSTEQQELMRLMLIDKQGQMKKKSAEDFDSLKNTTGKKFGDMRSNTDSTMSNLQGDYDTRLGDLRKLNKEGFESVKKTSNANMEGVRRGINREMEDARPQLGSRMNNLIGVLGKFSSSVNEAFGDVGVKLDAPAKLKYASGGVLPGYTPGQDIYRFHNPMVGNLELSGGEAIMRPEFVRTVGGAAGIDRLNKDAINGNLNREFYNFAGGGILPSWGFAGGGTLTEAAKWWQARNARITEFKAWGQRVGRHSPNSLHYTGRAFDANYGPGGTNAIEQAFFDRMMPPFKQEFPRIRVIWRAPGHFNHAHFDTGRGGDIGNAVGGGSFMMPHPFLDKAKVTPGSDIEASYAKAAEKLYSQIYAKHSKGLPGGFAGDLGKGIMEQAKEGLVKQAREYGKTAGSGDFSNVADGPIKQMAKQMLEQMGWGDQFGDLNWLLTRESGWRPNAQNPTSTAYGLFQFLDSTWGTVGGHKTSDPKLQLEYGLKYIRQRYGDVRGARDFWSRNRWYKGGAYAAQDGIAIVGEDGPEAIDLRGAERIRNAQQTRKLLAENRTFIPTAQQGLSAASIGDAIATSIRTQGINAQDLAEALNGVQLTFQADGHQFTGAVVTAIASGYQESRSRLAKSSQKMGAIR